MAKKSKSIWVEQIPKEARISAGVAMVLVLVLSLYGSNADSTGLSNGVYNFALLPSYILESVSENGSAINLVRLSGENIFNAQALTIIFLSAFVWAMLAGFLGWVFVANREGSSKKFLLHKNQVVAISAILGVITSSSALFTRTGLLGLAVTEQPTQEVLLDHPLTIPIGIVLLGVSLLLLFKSNKKG